MLGNHVDASQQEGRHVLRHVDAGKNPPMLSMVAAMRLGASEAVLGCPSSKQPLTASGAVLGSVTTSSFTTSSGTRYPLRPAGVGGMFYADLVPQKPIGLDELRDEFFSVFSMQTGIFRSPLMAFAYERGWRQNFEAMGFPGPDAEFDEVQRFFAPVEHDKTVVDLSCGSGLMSRRLVGSGRYERVFALDYSEEMLKETSRRFYEQGIATDRLTLVRADAAMLPLQTDSVDALHAGAAMHCWPRLEQSLEEVKRVLRPGGRFFATTFYEGALPGQQAQMQQPGSGRMRFFKDENELADLLVGAGFDASLVDVRREGRACAIVRAEV